MIANDIIFPPEFASPVLVPGGGVAIVAIGHAKWVMREGEQPGQAQRRLEVSISWSADHRVVEGRFIISYVLISLIGNAVFCGRCGDGCFRGDLAVLGRAASAAYCGGPLSSCI